MKEDKQVIHNRQAKHSLFRTSRTLYAMSSLVVAAGFLLTGTLGNSARAEPPAAPAGTGAAANPAPPSANSSVGKGPVSSEDFKLRTVTIPDFRAIVRDMVEQIATYGHGRNNHFAVVLRGGFGLMIKSERDDKVDQLNNPPTASSAAKAAIKQAMENGSKIQDKLALGEEEHSFLQSLDGAIMDGQYCGNHVTASPGYIRMMQNLGMVVISVDHCGSEAAATKAWQTGRANGILPHADSLTGPMARVPRERPQAESAEMIDALGKARNIWVFDKNDGYSSKEEWVQSMAASNIDVIVVDPFWRSRVPLLDSDIKKLKEKSLGSVRMVLARMDISHARNTDWYWQQSWTTDPPKWILGPVAGQPGVFETAPWSDEWREMVGHIVAGLMDVGYDGIVIEGSEVYRGLEAKTPLPP